MSQPLEYEQAGYNAPGGLQVGRTSTDLVAFYGTAPITRPAISGIVSTAAALSTVVSALAALGLVTDNTTA